MDRRRLLALSTHALLGMAGLRTARALEAAQKVFLAVGPGGQRMTSRDGRAWENHVSWGEPRHDQNDLNVAVFFRGAAYVGGGYSIARMTATRDGKNWSEGVLPKGSPIFGLEVLEDVLYAVDLRGQVYRSADGETYESVARAMMPTPTHWIRGTASGNGILVGSGDYGPAMAYDPKTHKVTVTQMAGQVEKLAGLKRVAFGNGIFVVGGQSGLLAASKDGVEWRNNEVQPDRGTITSVVWTGTRFLAVTDRKTAFFSPDGLTWTPREGAFPRQIVRAGDRLFGWSWPPHRFRESRDGVAWEAVPNDREFHLKHLAHGTLSGGATPPRLPEGKVPWAGMKPRPT